MNKSLLILCCLWFSTGLCIGQTVTLRHFAPKARMIYYTENALRSQIARFDVPTPCTLTRLVVWLGGDSRDGTARVRILGDEHGATAPFFGDPHAEEMTIRKTKRGVEAVVLDLPKALDLDGAQFFVEIRGPSPGVRLMSDAVIKAPACADAASEFSYQILVDSAGRYRSGRYAYAIEAVIRPRSTGSPAFENVTRDVLAADSLRGPTSIAWADLNGDGFQDLVAGGRVLINAQGARFNDITSAAGIPEGHGIDLAIDWNNDATPDIVSLRGEGSRLLINDGAGRFSSVRMPLPGITNPVCFCVVDANGDGYQDVLIGRAGAQSCCLLRNLGGTAFGCDSTMAGRPFPIANAGLEAIRPAGLKTTCIAATDSAAGTCSVWSMRSSEGAIEFSLVARHEAHGAIGGSWAEVESDHRLELLLPRTAFGTSGNGTVIARSSWLATWTAESGFVGTESPRITDDAGLIGAGAGSWADFNNDGRLDFLVASRSPCSYVNLFEGRPNGTFERVTAAYGLHRVSGGPDAAWTDFDNDGRPDFAFLSNGRLALYRNTVPPNRNHFVEFDLASRGAGSINGARVEVYAGGSRQARTVQLGRGMAIQEPARLHFGLGEADPDSVLVLWPGSEIPEHFTQIRSNTIARLTRGESAGESAGTLALTATPNPFRDELQITYRIAAEGPVTLDIYSVTGQRMARIVEEQRAAGAYTARWKARDASGRALPQGEYVLRLSDGRREISQSVLLAR